MDWSFPAGWLYFISDQVWQWHIKHYFQCKWICTWCRWYDWCMFQRKVQHILTQLVELTQLHQLRFLDLWNMNQGEYQHHIWSTAWVTTVRKSRKGILRTIQYIFLPMHHQVVVFGYARGRVCYYICIGWRGWLSLHCWYEMHHCTFVCLVQWNWNYKSVYVTFWKME